MPVISPRLRTRKSKTVLQKLSCFALIAFAAGASSAWGAVPAVVIDSQQTVGTGFNNPQSLAVNGTNKNAIFIADTDNNQMIALLHNYNFVFQPNGIILRQPQAVALDSKGDLFIGDTPLVNGVPVGRITEIPADNTGNLAGGGQVVFQGAPLMNPTALTVDSAGTLYIGDFSPSGAGAIYSLALNATTPTALTITNGPPAQWFPSALLTDNVGNLYFADNGTPQLDNGNVYVVPVAGGAASVLATPGFTLNQPTGLAFNKAGDLNLLTLLDTGAGLAQQVLVVPASSPSTPYILPTTGINTGSGLAFDGQNNLEVADAFNGAIFQVSYGSPTDFGSVNVGQTGEQRQFNFEFNQPTTLRGFRIVTQGDVSTDLIDVAGGTCTNGPHNGASAVTPYTCVENFQAAAKFPGLRTSSILVRGAGGAILASTPVYQIGFSGVEVTYPLRTTATASNLQAPQGVVISGDNKFVYVADQSAGVVYSIAGLGGSALTPVSTGGIALQSPTALALDGAGDLFIADFSLAEVIEVPLTSGAAPSVVDTGGLLQHPLSLAVDNLGDLYIGDAGPAGNNASSGNPGYIVKVPTGGVAFKMTIPSVPVIYPQALAANLYTNNLYVGDGGDLSGVGEVDVVLPDGSAAGKIVLDNIVNPTGLSFDPAGNLYVLDGTLETITGLPIYLNNPTPFQVGFDNTKLAAASSMAMSAGGQSFIITNVGQAANNSLIYLNGNRSVLKFGGAGGGNPSDPQTATEYNIGNLDLVLGTPFYSATPANNAFSILGTSTCGNNIALGVGQSCAINVKFSPTSSGQTTQQIRVNSTAYNSGVPILNLQGTGKVTGAVKRTRK